MNLKGLGLLLASCVVCWGSLEAQEFPPAPQGFGEAEPVEHMKDFEPNESARLTTIMQSRKLFPNEKLRAAYRQQVRRMLRMNDATRHAVLRHGVFELKQDVDFSPAYLDEFLDYLGEVQRDKHKADRVGAAANTEWLNFEDRQQAMEFSLFHWKVLEPYKQTLRDPFDSVAQFKSANPEQSDQVFREMAAQCRQFLLTNTTSPKVQKYVALWLVALPAGRENLTVLVAYYKALAREKLKVPDYMDKYLIACEEAANLIQKVERQDTTEWLATLMANQDVWSELLHGMNGLSIQPPSSSEKWQKIELRALKLLKERNEKSKKDAEFMQELQELLSGKAVRLTPSNSPLEPKRPGESVYFGF